ncbi:MAG: acetylglutamate kinase [Candidatus Eremiobacterota bacterium]
MIVVKYGGSALDDPGLETLLHEVRQLDAVLVHGGGPEISRLTKRLDLPSRFVDGLRVTDADTLAVAQMVLCGRINKQLVARLGSRAVGVSGIDGGVFACSRLSESLGFVGKIERVETKLIRTLSQAGFLPVVAPLGVGPDGTCYNLNADTAAAELAVALQASRLVYLTDVPGVLCRGRLLHRLSVSEADRMIATGEATGGMIPKLRACQAAARFGVPAQIVLAGTSLHSDGGTLMTPDLPAAA